MNKVTPFLMFNDQLEAAIAFYTATFPDARSRMLPVRQYGDWKGESLRATSPSTTAVCRKRTDKHTTYALRTTIQRV